MDVSQRVLANIDAGEPPDGDSTRFVDDGFNRLAHALYGEGADREGGPTERRILDLALQYERFVTSRNLASAESLWIQAVAEWQGPRLAELERELMGWQSLGRLHRGDSQGAIVRARQALSMRPLSNACRVAALTALARGHARLGYTTLVAWLDDALTTAAADDDPNQLGLVHVARSESAWLTGEDERARAEALRGLEVAHADGADWVVSELSFLAILAGCRDVAPAPSVGPFAAYGRGHFTEAAAAWEALGCPYEQALSLAGAAADAAQRAAFLLLDGLDMDAAARRVAERMKLAGLRSIPRGRRASTRANPAGLTGRELQVLALLTEGLRNSEIAERLGVAKRTVDHHVSSILSKTLEPDRRAAARWYRRHYLTHEATEQAAK